ncbi:MULTISPECIES: flagellar biosynthetic protein FliO [unclassified Rhizobium]|uniref:flagellar biosynthetic protein FliO n=1 Tax=unclassified Rhizobium TaxID=2613769 RepID=UPI0015CCAE09|nr:MULTISPECIES: flagellar biosynthetic protein FliO [unclassified Rhizobium]MDQ4407310.1 flagellar biosynthetic protein FliO [Rhizobium sp. AN63]
MISMMEDFIGTYGNNLIVAVVGVGLALLVLAIVLWILRRRGGAAPFIRGGRNRQPRLQVLDATAVDARRRLVLVRRDNVEHLVMIGGPTDIVIESGIGAIPIVREVREPQEAELKALPRQDSEPKRAEPPIPRESRPALPQQPIAAASPASLPEEPAKQPQRPEPPAPAARAPTPAPAASLPPRPSTPPQPVSTPMTAREPVAPTRPAAPERDVTRPAPPPASVIAAPAAAVLPLAAASLDMPAERPEQRRPDPFVPAPLPSAPPAPPVQATVPEERPTVVAPPVFAAREPVIDQTNAADFLDAARERVLPGLKPGQDAPPAPFAPKPENPPVVSANAEPKFSDDLASDFESFLEAEIAKSKDADSEQEVAAAAEKPKTEPVSPPVTGATPDGDMQKEMARIFGELSVTRDR